MRKNDIFEAEIVGYSSDGSGVCRINGRAVFVPRTIVGEVWQVKILKVTSSAVWGKAIEPVRLSPERRTPDCEYCVRCGGCTLRHMSYDEELRFKLGRLNDALTHIGRQTVQAEEIIGSDRRERYRNKGIYTVRSVAGELKSGFFAPRTHELVPVERCLLQNEAADRVTAAVLEFMRKSGIDAYDEKSRKGSVRHVFVRTAVNTADCVACIVTARGFGDKTTALTDYLRSACPELTGIVLNVNKTPGNTVLAGDFYTLWGRDTVCDSLGGVEYGISPQAFYQINPPQAEKLYNRAVEYAGCTENSTVLDLYCGAGTISLFLAKKAGRVIGAEIIPEAIEKRKAQRPPQRHRKCQVYLRRCGRGGGNIPERRHPPRDRGRRPAEKGHGRGSDTHRVQNAPRQGRVRFLQPLDPCPGHSDFQRPRLHPHRRNGTGHVPENKPCRDGSSLVSSLS